MTKEEFNLSEKRTELRKFLKKQGISSILLGVIMGNITDDDKEFIRLLKEEFGVCRDKTDIWGDEERWNKFEKMFKGKLNKLAGEELVK